MGPLQIVSMAPRTYRRNTSSPESSVVRAVDGCLRSAVLWSYVRVFFCRLHGKPSKDCTSFLSTLCICFYSSFQIIALAALVKAVRDATSHNNDQDALRRQESYKHRVHS